MLRADFQNTKGEPKSLRIMFVDKAPAQETIDELSKLLKIFANMKDKNGGQLADRLSGIFVYPSENAGLEHGDPKRIALGGDKQSDESVMGSYTYILDMAEFHMPTTWDAEELKRMFASFEGPVQTLAHEAGGHGTDESDQRLRLRRVLALGIPNAHVAMGNPQANKMRPLQGVLRKLLPVSRRLVGVDNPVEFDITYPVPDAAGNIVTMSARVNADDPRLAHATSSTIVGFQPTAYSGTSNAEHYAETAAATITGIPIPYVEASITVPELMTDDGQPAVFAGGYHPDTRGQKLFTESVGAVEGALPIAFKDPIDVKISHLHPANDPLLRAELIRTRNVRTLTPRQMVAILARVAHRKKGHVAQPDAGKIDA